MSGDYLSDLRTRCCSGEFEKIGRGKFKCNKCDEDVSFELSSYILWSDGCPEDDCSNEETCDRFEQMKLDI